MERDMSMVRGGRKMKIEFYECVLCGVKTKNPTDDWDFGVDIDSVEPDEDGGVRGTCPKCHASLLQR